MAAKLSNPIFIMGVYDSILENKCNWLLLTYSNNSQFDELSLFAHGAGGLEEMKSRMGGMEQVFIAFYREGAGVYEEVCGDARLDELDKDQAVVITTARALVHSRRVGAVFKKHQAILTIDHISILTTSAIHDALAQPTTTITTTSTPRGRTISQPIGINAPQTSSQAPMVIHTARRSFSETYAPGSYLPSSPAVKAGGVLSTFLRRKKRSGNSSDETDDDQLPPTPPKDKGNFALQRPQQTSYDYGAFVPQRRASPDVSEFAVVSHSYSSDEGIAGASRASTSGKAAQSPLPTYSIPLKGKWTPEKSAIRDPEERARWRIEAQRRKKAEEKEALAEEARRQAELKRRKEEARLQEIEDEEYRKAALEDELRRITAERRQKAQLEKEAEARKARELEEKKRMNRERRLEESRRLEEWRHEQLRLAEESAQRAQEEKKREEAERRQRIQLVEAKVKRDAKAELLFTGWVTIQTADSLVWKRRYFMFNGSAICLYRSEKDTRQALDTVELRGKLRGLREWNEGYEDLEAIPHSFVVEFKDGRGPWSMFSDSEDEKDKLLGLLHHAAGL